MERVWSADFEVRIKFDLDKMTLGKENILMHKRVVTITDDNKEAVYTTPMFQRKFQQNVLYTQKKPVDMEILVNYKFDFYTGIEPVLNGKYDFIQTVLHEIQHGLQADIRLNWSLDKKIVAF